MSDRKTIVRAYTEKYDNDDDESYNGDDDSIQIVFVKRKRFRLQSLVLDNCAIERAGSQEHLAEICSAVVDCDLSHNNLGSWDDIFQLLDVSPRINFLNLSSNSLGICNTLKDATYENLTVLVLCGNQIVWENFISNVMPCFKSLQELNIASNGLSELPRTTDIVYESLHQLNVVNNNIASFDDISEVSTLFPNLKSLFISDNPLSCLGTCEEKVAGFKNLNKLYLNNVVLNCWSEVSKLRWFPKLDDLRITYLQLFGEIDEADRCKILAALLPDITLINGAPINDRESAERWFMRQCQALHQVDEKRYCELIDKHGPLPDLVDIKLGGEDETITLNISVPERGTEFKKTYSVYDTLNAIKTDVEADLGRELSRKHITIKKKDDPDTSYPLYKLQNMLYQAFRQTIIGYPAIRGNPASRVTSVNLVIEEGDTLTFKLRDNSKDFPIKVRPIKTATNTSNSNTDSGPTTVVDNKSCGNSTSTSGTYAAGKPKVESKTKSEDLSCEFMQSHKNLNTEKGFFVEF